MAGPLRGGETGLRCAQRTQCACPVSHAFPSAVGVGIVQEWGADLCGLRLAVRFLVGRDSTGRSIDLSSVELTSVTECEE